MSMKEIAEKIALNGGRLYLVGGAVRDKVLGIEPHDEDYCVTGIELTDFIDMFPNEKVRGADFPVFIIQGNEVALARSEEKISQGYRGFKINTSKDITIEQDLKRRDITINAMAQDVLTEKIIDPYGGIEDLRRRTIRHVSEAFKEDPLRCYRVARFAAKYNFEVDKETKALMATLKEELATISEDRVFVEVRKVLETDNPSVFFYVLKETDLLDVHFKELKDLVGQSQPEEYHPEGDAFDHSMIVLDKVAKETSDPSIRFCALVHDLGKGITPKEELPHHYGHDKAGVEIIDKMGKRLRFPTDWVNKAKVVSKYHMVAARYKEMRPYKQAIMFNIIEHTSLGLKNLEIIVNADEMLGRGKVEFADMAKEVMTRISGKNLKKEGITPESVGGEQFGHILLERQAKLIKEYEEKQKLENLEK